MNATTARLAATGLVRAPGRTLLRVLVLAASVALLAGMLLFIGDSLHTVSGTAVRSVPLDLQGPVSSQSSAVSVARRVAGMSGVQAADPVATAPLVAASHAAGSVATQAGAGAILAVPPNYARDFHVLRMLQGAQRPGGVVLDQQMAATLQAHLGDQVQLTTRTGAPPVALTVTGVAIVTAADTLFQPLDPAVGPAPAQPPANIAIVDVDTFAARLAPTLRTLTAASLGSSVQPGAQDGVQWQVQVQLDPAPLSTGNPSAALAGATQAKNRIERGLPGQVRFVDNLSDSLTTAAGDALYAQALYVMLALPGALIALGLAWLAALGTAERDRAELSLLRARGLARRHLLAIAGYESVLLGIVAGVLGAMLAVAALELLVPGGARLTVVRSGVTVGISIALAIAGAAAARIGASLSALAGSVSEGRHGDARRGTPWWQRTYLDLICLAISGVVYWMTARTGFSAIVNPDSNPTLSLSFYMFLAPSLLWVGATLLLVRLRGRMVSWLGRRVAGPRATGMAGFLLASASRRASAINRGLIVVGLLLAFGVNLGIFTQTYVQQSKVDAQLTLGADVAATVAPGVVTRRHLEQRISKVSGVDATTGVDHSYSYIGPDLQDTYGIDPKTFAGATTLRDYFFLGVTAREALHRLATTPDGILVSKETITDYSLHRGDLVKLRVLDRRSSAFHIVRFHVVGTVQEFPSAPKDSFMVANLRYLSAASHSGGPNVVFARVHGDPKAVARRIAAATRDSGTHVEDITTQQARTSSAITTVDLLGISRIEEAFVILLAGGAMALFVLLGIAERRREFATMAAIGAPMRRIVAFLWVEAGIVLVLGTILAAGLGWLLSMMLVAMLQHVFDPPPDVLAVPWSYLAALAIGTLLATAVATAFAVRGIRRMSIGAVLREQ